MFFYIRKLYIYLSYLSYRIETASIGEKASTHWKGCFQWVERMLPDSGNNASDGWKLWGKLFCQEGIGKRLELLDGVGLDG